MEHRLIRALCCYSNSNERLVFDVRFQNFSLEKFQAEFCVARENPMYDSFPIATGNVPFLIEYLPLEVDINWDFEVYSYFVETEEN